MTKLIFTKITKLSANLNKESSLPPLNGISLKKYVPKIDYDETRGLFAGFGYLYSQFPHREYNRYTRELSDTEFDAVILENEHLRAEFIPSLGGRLWSLYDKDACRDILFNNPVVRYCNLSNRNAWTSGGTEFNIGEIGHHAYTCDSVFAARTELADGTPVLRMYEFNRIRRVVYQMDFWIPEDSKVLFARMRVVNPNLETVPMYWWSNTAVPSHKNGRILVPADEAFAHDYADGRMIVVPVPERDGKDMSYDSNNPCSDSYYYIKDGVRRFICYSDESGYTYAHTSTSRLKSRKLFVWGNGEGGARWQEFLSGNGNPGRYIELQAGLANTQAEHIPMPPLTAWEWLETYGAVKLDPKAVYGRYEDAVKAAERELDNVITEQELERLLADTKPMAVSPAKELLHKGHGWGALENTRRRKCGDEPLTPHLDFGAVGCEQEQWLRLLENGSLGEHSPHNAPVSWMRQEEWTELLEKAASGPDKENWYTFLHLGCIYLAEHNFRLAKEALQKSVALNRNAWSLYALSAVFESYSEFEKAAGLMLEALSLNPDDISLTLETARKLNLARMFDKSVAFFGSLDGSVREIGRIRFYYAYALLNTGDARGAYDELHRNGGIEVADIRECEIGITDLWFDIEEALAKLEGRPFDRSSAMPPKCFDFRMISV